MQGIALRWIGPAIFIVGMAQLVWLGSHQEHLPTRLSDGSISLETADFDRRENAALSSTRWFDHWNYLAMAEAPFSEHGRSRFKPHCWRVLTPLAVHVVPLDREHAFYLFSFAGIAFAALATLAYLRTAIGDEELALWGLAFFFVMPATQPLLVRYTYLEATTLPFFAAGILLIERGRFWSLVALLAVGVLQRETVLLIAPIALLREWLNGGSRPLRFWLTRIALLIGLPAAILTALHLALPDRGGFEIVASIRYFWHKAYLPHLTEGLLHAVSFVYTSLINPWGLAGIFATTVGVLGTARYFRNRPHEALLWMLVYAGVIMGPNIDRYVCYLAPIAIACSLAAFRDLFPGRAWLRAALALAITIQWFWNLKLVWPELWPDLRVRYLVVACLAAYSALGMKSMRRKAA